MVFLESVESPSKQAFILIAIYIVGIICIYTFKDIYSYYKTGGFDISSHFTESIAKILKAISIFSPFIAFFHLIEYAKAFTILYSSRMDALANILDGILHLCIFFVQLYLAYRSGMLNKLYICILNCIIVGIYLSLDLKASFVFVFYLNSSTDCNKNIICIVLKVLCLGQDPKLIFGVFFIFLHNIIVSIIFFSWIRLLANLIFRNNNLRRDNFRIRRNPLTPLRCYG